MLEMKLTKGRMISSDGKFNFILMNGDKAIGYYNTWERLHESMNRGNKKLSKKDLEKINEVSAMLDTSIKQINDVCKKFKKDDNINISVFDFDVRGVNFNEVCIYKKGGNTIIASMGTVQSCMWKITQWNLMNGEDLTKSTKQILKSL